MLNCPTDDQFAQSIVLDAASAAEGFRQSTQPDLDVVAAISITECHQVFQLPVLVRGEIEYSYSIATTLFIFSTSN